MINIIVAADLNGVIGADGKLPWHLPGDLIRFKRLTTGHPVVMGRKTYESMPFYPKGLPNRENVIISRTLKEVPGCSVYDSLEEFLSHHTATGNDEDIWIIGGGEIYKQAIKYADCIYLTQVNTRVENGDTYFNIPEEDKKEFSLAKADFVFDEPHPYIYKTYVRHERLIEYLNTFSL